MPLPRIAAGEARADGDLVIALLAGKPEAFHRFYEEWFPRVLAFARREREPEAEARALCERILRRVLEELPGFSGRVSLARIVLAAAVLESREAAPPEVG